jgi:hypothetical protein
LRWLTEALKGKTGNNFKGFDTPTTDERSIEAAVRFKVLHLRKFFGSSRITHCVGGGSPRASNRDRDDGIGALDEFNVDWRLPSTPDEDTDFFDDSADLAALELEFEELDFDIELALLGVQSSNHYCSGHSFGA